MNLQQQNQKQKTQLIEVVEFGTEEVVKSFDVSDCTEEQINNRIFNLARQIDRKLYYIREI